MPKIQAKFKSLILADIERHTFRPDQESIRREYKVVPPARIENKSFSTGYRNKENQVKLKIFF